MMGKTILTQLDISCLYHILPRKSIWLSVTCLCVVMTFHFETPALLMLLQCSGLQWVAVHRAQLHAAWPADSSCPPLPSSCLDYTSLMYTQALTALDRYVGEAHKERFLLLQDCFLYQSLKMFGL